MSIKNQTYSLLLSSSFLILLIVSGCRTAERVPAESQIKVSQPWVFNLDFKKAIYKTNLLVYGNEISGLTMIKNTDQSFRVVLMSEVGLKYFDMEFSQHTDSIKVHYVINLLDHKPVVEMLENNFRLLFMKFPEKRSEKFFTDSRTNSMIKEYKYKGQKSRYTFDSNFGMVRSIRDKKRGRNLAIAVNIKNHLSPQTINSNQPNFNIRLEMLE